MEKKVLQDSFDLVKRGLTPFGDKWLKKFEEEVFIYGINIVRLGRDCLEEDLFFIKDSINKGFLDIEINHAGINCRKMDLDEMNIFSECIPKSFELLIKTMQVFGNVNYLCCRAFTILLSYFAAYIFQELNVPTSLDNVRSYGRYIRNLDQYLKEMTPEELMKSEEVQDSQEPTEIYIQINGKSFDEVFDSGNNIIDPEISELLSENEEENTEDDENEEEENTQQSNQDTLEDNLNKLDELIGLQEVKKQVKTLMNLALVQKEREKRNLKSIQTSQHLVFVGNPGTGKTTVARLLGSIFHNIGILSKGYVVEVDRSELIGEYVGHTAVKTQKVIDSAIGGILFIDEAYSITASDSNNDFGPEAIAVLLKEMEDKRDDFIVIVAGYPNEMSKFINSNPGLKSRFKKTIMFEDYSAEELFQILQKLCKENGFELHQDVKEKLIDKFQEEIDKKSDNFANARYVRNVFEKAIENQANRIVYDGEIEDDELTTLYLVDFDKQ